MGNNNKHETSKEFLNGESSRNSDVNLRRTYGVPHITPLSLRTCVFNEPAGYGPVEVESRQSSNWICLFPFKQEPNTHHFLHANLLPRSCPAIYSRADCNIRRICARTLSCALSTFARREGIKRSLYFALVSLNFISSREPETSTPKRKGIGDFRTEI